MFGWYLSGNPPPVLNLRSKQTIFGLQQLSRVSKLLFVGWHQKVKTTRHTASSAACLQPLNHWSCCNSKVSKVKSFPSHEAHTAALTWFLSPQLTLRDHRCRASVSSGVPVYSPGTHYTYPRRDGQAELNWVVGYILRWFTRPQTVRIQVLTGSGIE